jgi:hypothetical protein
MPERYWPGWVINGSMRVFRDGRTGWTRFIPVRLLGQQPSNHARSRSDGAVCAVSIHERAGYLPSHGEFLLMVKRYEFQK